MPKAQEGLYGAVGPRTGLAEGFPAVYLRRGRVTHLIPKGIDPNDPIVALCGTGPSWYDTWRGTGTEEEYDLARSMPLCLHCLRVLKED